MNPKTAYKITSYGGIFLLLLVLYQFTMDTISGRRVWIVSLWLFIVTVAVVHVIVAGQRHRAGEPFRRRNWFLLP